MANSGGAIEPCATFIDNILISHNFARLLRSLDIDEEGDYSIVSDNNRIRVDFSRTHLKPSAHTRCEGPMRLPAKGIEAMTTEFEDSRQRREEY